MAAAAAGATPECHLAPHVLREYALLADGERGALIGPGGDVAWLCAPRWDDDAVFCSLIGGRGNYAITPAGRFTWGGYYEHGLIWRSRWVTTSGIVECREALAFPGDRHRLVLLRQVLAIRGPARVSVQLEPAAAFGRHGMKHLHRDQAGHWHAEVGGMRMRFRGAAEAIPQRSADGIPSLRTTLELPEGAHHDLVFELSDGALHDTPTPPQQMWDATETAWANTIPTLGASIAPHDARHSYAVLRGLTSAGGGMVAAATMSLPERADRGRNYDYRYVWIRDQCYAGQAVAADGPHPLLDTAVRFVSDRLLADGPHLKPAYTTTGAAVPDERSLHLPGYPGGTDIVGNHANSQFQLDIFGEALLLFSAAAGHDRLDTEAYRAIVAAVAAIRRCWRQPDAGIWELDNRRWAHSRLTCVAGLRAIAAHASRRDAADWSALADVIAADTADCVHPGGRWQRAPTDVRVDAALLLPAVRGAVSPNDPRSIATVEAVRDELARDHYVYRFRQNDRPLHEAEGAFTLCGFLMALATHQQGDQTAAVRYFERNRSACGPPGLFCEEYDIVERQLRGNLPQAFVHALMLECSLRLACPPPHTDRSRES
ncbi:glycoside hydrolase family 15 protein [Mycolicibacterium sphagni]|uniref:Glycoside hydrolase n=1 Tax=Mycolicibacterium sphagni TaxID=1786 RepID=A0A255DDR6_9MYCO|nr:glycoside hydrolase family 15 protein [Mycolicibacterium sphagni]OYN77568.1 glycoside hydrolase [Mycolicibacterium sphagni]